MTAFSWNWRTDPKVSRNNVVPYAPYEKGEVVSISRELATLSPKDASEILEKISCNTKRLFNKTRDRQKRKFDDLLIEKQSSVSTTRTPHIDRTPQVDKSKWVINLSSRSLSDTEVSLLQKGLNFAITPTSIPATEIIAKVESAIRPLDAEQADTVRRNVNSILQKAKPPEPNITREMKQALKGLKEDKNITILPADKGRASVVLDKNTYDDKVRTLIEKGPHRLLNKDPTDRLSRKLTEKLLDLKRGGHLTESVYNKIRPKHKQPPRVYGLPKIHKVNTLLRPIVSCVNTFAYDLSSYLADVLSPLTGKSEYTVNNSVHFVSTINGERVLESEIMVSFDVEYRCSQTYQSKVPYRPRYGN